MTVSKPKDAARNRHQLAPPQRATKPSALFGPVDMADYDYAWLLQQELDLDKLESLSKSTTRAKYDGLIELYNSKIKDPGDPLFKDDPESVRIVYNWVHYVRNGTHGWDAETQLVNSKHMKKILELRPVELTMEVEKGLNEFIRRREPIAKVCRKKPSERTQTSTSRREGTSRAAAKAVARNDTGNDRLYMEDGILNLYAQKYTESLGPVERMNGNKAALQPTHDEYDAWARQNATSGHVRSRNQSWSTLVEGEEMTFCFQGDPTELQRFINVTIAEGNDPRLWNCLRMNEAPCAMFTCLAVMANTSEAFLRGNVAAVIEDHLDELCSNGYLNGREPDQVLNDLETGRSVGGLCELLVCAVLLRVPIMLFGYTKNGVHFPHLPFRPDIKQDWADDVRGQNRLGSASAPIALWWRAVMHDNGDETHQIDLICNVSGYACAHAGSGNDDFGRMLPNATAGQARSRNQSWPTRYLTESQRFSEAMIATRNDPRQWKCLCMNQAQCAIFACLAVRANTSELAIRRRVAEVIQNHLVELCANGHLNGRQPDRVLNELITGRSTGGHCELVICAVLLRVKIAMFGTNTLDGLTIPPLRFLPTIDEPWAHVIRGHDRVGSATGPIALWCRTVLDNNGEVTSQIDLICNVSSYASGGTLADDDGEDSRRHSNAGLKRRRSQDENHNGEKRQLEHSLSSRKQSRQKSANTATSIRKQSDSCDDTAHYKDHDAHRAARAKEKKASAPQDQVQPTRRLLSERPVHKISVSLLDTFKNINSAWHKDRDARRAARTKEKARDEWDDENYDYIVTSGEMFDNRYKILERIGKGSFGQVVRAEDMETRREVAIKIIKSKKPFRLQAKTEIELLTHLSEKDPNDEHNIVRLLDHFMHRNHQCLVFDMLFLNLYELLKNTQLGGVSLNLVRKFGAQVLKSLAFLAKSDVDIVHCDLKPENIMLCQPSKSGIKVIDFGLSCRSNERMYSYIQSRWYRSPEVVLKLPYNQAMDMWSLGCILAEMHTGKPLFEGSDEFDLMQKIVKLLGMVPTDMLERSADKVKLQFFEKKTTASGQEEWQLRETTPSVSTSPSKPEVESATSETTGKIVPGTDAMASLKSVIVAGNQQKKKFPMSETYNSAGNYDLFLDLLYRMLAHRPEDRITPEEALSHPFIVSFDETG